MKIDPHSCSSVKELLEEKSVGEAFSSSDLLVIVEVVVCSEYVDKISRIELHVMLNRGGKPIHSGIRGNSFLIIFNKPIESGSESLESFGDPIVHWCSGKTFNEGLIILQGSDEGHSISGHIITDVHSKRTGADVII